MDWVQSVYVERTERARGVRDKREVVKDWRSEVIWERRVETAMGSCGMFRWRKEELVVGWRRRVRGRAALVR